MYGHGDMFVMLPNIVFCMCITMVSNMLFLLSLL